MIYLDSAATSLLKPPEVGEAMLQALSACASPGRGVHAPAMAAADIAYACREEAAALFHMREPEKVTFTMNTTHGLNIAIRSVVKPGMRVVVSGYEHNAVMRPLYALGAAVYVVQTPNFDSENLIDRFRDAVPGSGAVICTHVSNVFGYKLPMEEIAAICRESNVPLIIDAAQSAGVYDIDFTALEAEFIAMPGHKGLLGPQGTGLLLCNHSAEPLLYGGTGSMSASPQMPEDFPDRLEAGTQNICGVAGLLAGIRYIRAHGLEVLRCREEKLSSILADGLSKMEKLYVPLPEKANRAGVISVIPREMSCEELTARLGEAGVAVRPGLQCAPLAHKTAGTFDTGTVRFSLSPFNTEEEVIRALEITEKNLKI